MTISSHIGTNHDSQSTLPAFLGSPIIAYLLYKRLISSLHGPVSHLFEVTMTVSTLIRSYHDGPSTYSPFLLPSLLASLLQKRLTLLSSPEQKVLMVSYCDQPLSVVVRKFLSSPEHKVFKLFQLVA